MLQAAVDEGLAPGGQIVTQLRKASAKNDYVRVRYMVTENPSDISSVNVIKLVDGVRECVRKALAYDELGNPIPSQPSKDKRTTQNGL